MKYVFLCQFSEMIFTEVSVTCIDKTTAITTGAQLSQVVGMGAP